MKSFSSEGVILKRHNYGEADRIVTIYTKDFGKLTAFAKGARKISSRKKGGLEPGTISKCLFVSGKGMPLITQTNIVTSHAQSQQNLILITQTLQILEIVDLLSADEEPNREVYTLLADTLENISNGSSRQGMLGKIKSMVGAMGFGPPDIFSEYDLKEYIEDLSNRKLRSKQFLTITTKNAVQ